MIALCVASVAIAWLVGRRARPDPEGRTASRNLKLVFAAAVIDQARRQRRPAGEFPRPWP